MKAHFAAGSIALLAAASLGFGQQADALQQQLQQLKQQYIDTTHELEQRIAALEKQIAEQKQDSSKSISASELAAEHAAKAIVRGSEGVDAFQGKLPSEPTYDLLR